MVNTVTFPSTTLSAVISPLLGGTDYYYQITALNGTTRGDPSAVQHNMTAAGQSFSLVLINGRLYIENNQLAVTVPELTKYILNNTGGVITLTNGQTLSYGSNLTPVGSVGALTISDILIHSVTLSWGVPTGDPPFSYQVQQRQTGTSTWTNVATTPNTSFNVTNLLASTSYDFEVIPSNDVVTSTIAPTPNSATTLATVTPNISNLQFVGATQTSVTLQWNTTPGYTYTSFAIFYQLQPSGTSTQSSDVPTLVAANTWQVIINGLVNGNYNVSVLPFSSESGYGAAYVSLLVDVGSSTLSNITGIVGNVKNGVMTINWNMIGGLPPISYNIFISAGSSGPFTLSATVLDAPTITFTPLF